MAEFSFVLSLTERCQWMDIEKERKRGADRQSHRGHMCKYEAEGTTQIPISGGKNNAIVLTDVQWWGNCLTRDNDTDISCTRTHARALSEAGRSRWAGWSELQRRPGSTGTQMLTLNRLHSPSSPSLGNPPHLHPHSPPSRASHHRPNSTSRGLLLPWQLHFPEASIQAWVSIR